MLDEIPTTHKVYINTTLPVSKTVSEEDIIAFTEKNKDKITCINVSRHMQHYVQESNDGLLAKLAVPFRINCVLYKQYPKDGIVPYLERLEKFPELLFSSVLIILLQLRKIYMTEKKTIFTTT
jgi:hypothetical protein